MKTASIISCLMLIFCFFVSCSITAPYENLINIRIVNNSDAELKSFSAYTITFDEVKPNDTRAFQSTAVPVGLYRSRSHHISFIVDSISFKCYGQPLYDGNFTVVIERSQADSLFSVTVNGDAKSDSTLIYATDL